MRGPFKNQALSLLRERKVPIASILDVGVLTGTPEVGMAFADLPHVLFEPVVEFNSIIRNHYAGINHRLVNAAVSDSEGETTLEVQRLLSDLPISHSQIVAGDANEVNKRRVPMLTLDGYLSREPSPAPYFLKIDVDGHELPILRGAEHTLKQTSVVMIEATRHYFTERVMFLEQRGFRLFDLVNPCYYDGRFWQCDAILIRDEIADAHFAGFRSEDIERLYTQFDDSAALAQSRLDALVAELERRGMRIQFSG